MTFVFSLHPLQPLPTKVDFLHSTSIQMHTCIFNVLTNSGTKQRKPPPADKHHPEADSFSPTCRGQRSHLDIRWRRGHC